MRIKEGDEWKAAFITPLGLFEPTVMFFGLCGSPPTFQVFMNHNFADYICEQWLVIYMDDLVIDAHSMDVLEQFCTLNLSLKLSKCKFDKAEIEFLSMIVGSGCIHMGPAKLSVIATWPPPKSVKAVHALLGFCNFYRKFIPGFSNVIAPLTALTHKNYPWMWGPPQQVVFTTLLSHFHTTPVLHLPNVQCSFIVMTDTSLLASGGVLMQ